MSIHYTLYSEYSDRGVRRRSSAFSHFQRLGGESPLAMPLSHDSGILRVLAPDDTTPALG